MSSFGKTCSTCQKQINLSDKSGDWKPYNLDGTQHWCYENNNKQGTKGQENTLVSKKALTVEERLKRLEQIVLDPRSSK